MKRNDFASDKSAFSDELTNVMAAQLLNEMIEKDPQQAYWLATHPEILKTFVKGSRIMNRMKHEPR